ncbi:MAG: hypothetical protein AAF969_00735 [Bacteroidota bacterium]
MKENFIERWILDLVKQDYETGKIPKRATYKLKERMNNLIEVTIEWADTQSNDFKIVYNARSHGRIRPYEPLHMDDETIFELENYYTLEIHTYINQIKRNYSSRRIANYDVMKVIGELEHLDGMKNLNTRMG